MTADLDLDAVRSRFPALAREVAGRPAAFLDGPGGSQVPDTVIAAMTGHLAGGTANDGGVFVTSLETIDLIADARSAAADLTGSEPDEIAFGANMTTLNFLLAHAVARTLEAGDEVIVTTLDHDANVAPWLRVAEDHGLVVRRAPVRLEDATLDVDAVLALIGDRTRVVAVTLASNAVGSLTDLLRIAAAAREAGALVWTDAVHLAPHRRPDRAAFQADVLLFSPYKLFGPHLGVAAIRRDLAESWPADRVRPASETPPGHRFETGTPSFEALAGFLAAVEYLEGLGGGGAGATRTERLDGAYARVRAYEETLTRRVLERLAGLESVTVHGIADPARAAERTPTFCLSLDGVGPREVAERLAADGIFTWDGDYYAFELMRALGLAEGGGAVRAGFLHYNTAEEADRLCDALAAIARR